MTISRYWVGILLALMMGSVESQTLDQDATSDRPNILLIVVDDLGWSDLGSFGSEIRTPNLDAMASEGLTMTNFHVAPTCSPTRSMLLTGVDNHLAGVGTMENLQAPNQVDSENYKAELSSKVITIAEVLKSNGYSTMMSGKWHLADSEVNYPHHRGFGKSFALLQGGASHFSDGLPLFYGKGADYLEDGKPVDLPDNFYSTISYTDKLIQFLQERDKSQPFFGYLALTAPHDPLQVPDEWLDRYRGVYKQGPEKIGNARLERQKQLGLFSEDIQVWTAPTFPAWLPFGKKSWGQRDGDEKTRDERSMEIYASMIEIADQQIGRVQDWLQQQNLLDNTIIIFMSDNGANSATPMVYRNATKKPDKATREWFLSARDQSLENMGKRGSHTFLGAEWAAVSNTPFAFYKGTVGEGGIRVPFIVKGPGIERGQRTSQYSHVKDIIPTLLQAAGIEPEGLSLYDNKYLPQGTSLQHLWHGTGQLKPRVVGTELFGSKAVIEGPWKARSIAPPMGSGLWELYNIDQDPAESKNLAESQSQKLQELVKAYEEFSKENGVIPPLPSFRPSVEALYAGPCNWWCQFQLDLMDTAIGVQAYVREKF